MDLKYVGENKSSARERADDLSLPNILTLYKDNAYPSATEFRKIARKAGFKLDAINQFLKGQSEQHVFKAPKANPNNHLVCSAYDYCVSIDLMDMSRFAQQNGNHRWILTAIDWRTRYGWAMPLKRKLSSDVAPALEHIIKSLPHYEDAFIRLISDKGTEFLGDVNKALEKLDLNIFRLWNIPDRRKSSVLVERFNRTILTMLRRVFEHNNNYKWVAILPTLVQRYNSTKHRVLFARTSSSEQNFGQEVFNIIPEKFMERLRERDHLPELTIDLSRRPPQEFKPGDLVRHRVKSQGFDKATLSKHWSSKVYEVVRFEKDKVVIKDPETDKELAEKFLQPELIPSIEADTADKGPDEPNETMLKQNKTKRLQSRSNIKPGHEVAKIKETGEVVFKKRQQPAAKKRVPKKKVLKDFIENL